VDDGVQLVDARVAGERPPAGQGFEEHDASEKTSLRASAGSPRICSGAM